MATKKDVIVLKTATTTADLERRKNGPQLSKDQFAKELNYQMAAYVARTTCKQKLVRTGELKRVLNRLLSRFRPIISSLLHKK